MTVTAVREPQIMNSTETLLLGGSGTALQLHADMFLGLRALRRLVATDVAAPALHRDLLRGMPRLRDLTLRGVIPSLPYDAFVEVAAPCNRVAGLLEPT